MPSLRGAANTPSCIVPSAPARVAETTCCDSLTSTRTSSPSPTGTRSAPRSTRATSSSGASRSSKGPAVGSGSSRIRVLPRRGRVELGPVGPFLPASAGHYSRSACPAAPSAGSRATGRAVPAGAALGRRQLVDLDELRASTRWNDELRDPVAAGEAQRRGRIVVDHDDLDLAAVAGVDGARRVDQPEAGPRGQTGPRVHERGVAVRERNRDPGRQHRSLAGRERDVDGRDDIGARVAGQRVGGERQVFRGTVHQHTHSAPCAATALPAVPVGAVVTDAEVTWAAGGATSVIDMNAGGEGPTGRPEERGAGRVARPTARRCAPRGGGTSSPSALRACSPRSSASRDSG